MSELSPELLKALPPQAVAIFAFAFALALLVAKIFDIVEKWQKIRGSSPAATLTTSNSNKDLPVLSKKTIAGYAFAGAIFLPLLTVIAYSVFIKNPQFLHAQLFAFGSYVIYSIFGTLIVVFYVRKKFDLVNHNKIVALLTGFGVTTVISS